MTRLNRGIAVVVTAACAVAAGSCAPDPIVAPISIPASALDTGLTALRKMADLQLTSRADLSIRFVLVERRYFDLHSDELCFGEDACGFSLAPGESTSIPLGYISGYEYDANQVYVQWWSPDDPLRQPGAAAPVRRLVVTLAMY